MTHRKHRASAHRSPCMPREEPSAVSSVSAGESSARQLLSQLWHQTRQSVPPVPTGPPTRRQILPGLRACPPRCAAASAAASPTHTSHPPTSHATHPGGRTPHPPAATPRPQRCPCAQRGGPPLQSAQSKVESGAGRLSWGWTRAAGRERGGLAQGEDLGKDGLRNAGGENFKAGLQLSGVAPSRGTSPFHALRAHLHSTHLAPETTRDGGAGGRAAHR